MSMIDRIHGSYVLRRRVRVLSRLIAELLPRNIRLLDIGSGDGLIDRQVMELRPDVSIHGVDVLVRPDARIPVTAFDGTQLPFSDRSFDVAMMIDVLHHTDDPMVLLREAKRVARVGIVVKDHLMQGFAAGLTLRFMDRRGNVRHGVRVPYNYWTPRLWSDAFTELQLEPDNYRTDLGLYPFPANVLFGRRLHFLTFLGSR